MKSKKQIEEELKWIKGRLKLPASLHQNVTFKSKMNTLKWVLDEK